MTIQLLPHFERSFQCDLKMVSPPFLESAGLAAVQTLPQAVNILLLIGPLISVRRLRAYHSGLDRPLQTLFSKKGTKTAGPGP